MTQVSVSLNFERENSVPVSVYFPSARPNRNTATLLIRLTVSSIPGPRLPSDPFFGFDKCAHGLEYFIFTIIILVTLRKQQMRKCSVKELYWIVGFIACFAKSFRVKSRNDGVSCNHLYFARLCLYGV